MKMSRQELTVFPGEAARRRYERDLVRRHPAADVSHLTTLRRFTDHCERAARLAGLLQGRNPSAIEQRLLLEEAAEAPTLAPGQPLAALTLQARIATLRALIERVAVFSDRTPEIIHWLLAHAPDHKLHGAGQLLRHWLELHRKRHLSSLFDLNTALLRLAETGPLPGEFQAGLRFCAVRWLNPFEERLVAALKTRLGAERVQVFSTLPGAHAELAEARLHAIVHSESSHHATTEWAPWLEDFADAYETDDRNLPSPGTRERVRFLVSANPYGEIEDVARRLHREIQGGTPPDQLALIVRHLSSFSDVIPDVLKRFGIPYHLRRGLPAAAAPPVKTLMALLALPHTRSRDRLCDLLLMPGIDWPGIDPGQRTNLARQLRHTEPPVLRCWPGELAGCAALDTPGSGASRRVSPRDFARHVRTLIAQHALALPAEVLALIEPFESAPEARLPAERMRLLFEQFLDETLLEDPSDTENGVWVLTALDAAGLRFDSVYLAGLNDGGFPQTPPTDPLFTRDERAALKAYLHERQIPCPGSALPDVDTALVQEEILFLTAISSARERLTLSCAIVDAGGGEMAPGSFLERARGVIRGEKPELGASFHTILPPSLSLAEDEVRQTQAAFATHDKPNNNPLPAVGDPEKIRALLAEWMRRNPEFSPTALESLARNRLVFVLEKVIGIRPERLHEDETDPMERGTLIHEILEQIYTAIARESRLMAAPYPAAGGLPAWRLCHEPAEGAIALAVLTPGETDRLVSLAREIALSACARVERHPARRLGHPEIWKTEKQKLLRTIENYIRTDCETAAEERRYPALFEMQLGAASALPLQLERNGQRVALKGKVDRVDLVFNDRDELDGLVVIDYKGRSRDDSPGRLEKKIALNLDCQLPIYTFAAQQRFFGQHNTPDLNRITRAVYHLQERDRKKMASAFKRRMEIGEPLAAAFLETLFDNLHRLSEGDLAPEVLIAGYEDWSPICRTLSIDPEDWLKQASRGVPTQEAPEKKKRTPEPGPVDTPRPDSLD